MTPVQQLTPFTCGLACIESLARDLGVDVSQCSLLRDFKALLRKGVPKIEQFGATSGRDVAEILIALGFTVGLYTSKEKDAFRAVIRALGRNQAFLAFITISGEHHTMRVGKMADDEHAVLMDPNFNYAKAEILTLPLDKFINPEFGGLLITKP